MKATIKDKFNNIAHTKYIMPILLAAYWITIFILTHIPIPKVVYKAHVSDKTLHFIAYLILTFLLWTALSQKKINWRKLKIWWVVIVLISYGVIDEWIQEYIGRSMDLLDFCADMTGVAAGLILLSFIEFKTCFIIVAGISILSITTLAKEDLGQLMPKIYSTFHFSGYGFFAQLWIWKLNDYGSKIKLSLFRWGVIALAFPLAFLTAVILAAKLTGRYFELKNMIIAIGAILAVVVLNRLLWILHKKNTTKLKEN